jgi:transcriptional regulator with XRE-family HTH domain
MQMSGSDNPEHLNSIGKRLIHVRLARGLSQTAVALAAGLEQPNLSRWENDARKPNRASLLMLARALDVAEEWLRYGPEGKPVRVKKNIYLASAEDVREETNQNKLMVAAARYRR